jgi:uncharacterized membrane protein
VRLARALRHLTTPDWTVRRAFPAAAMQAIGESIARSEGTHGGEVRFAVEHALELPQLLAGITAHQRALQVFSDLRVWDTEHNNGVLIYFLLADQDFEIVADRGIHTRVGTQGWEEICRRMESMIRERRFQDAVLAGVEAIGDHLRRHYPRAAGDRNELPDRPEVL